MTFAYGHSMYANMKDDHINGITLYFPEGKYVQFKLPIQCFSKINYIIYGDIKKFNVECMSENISEYDAVIISKERLNEISEIREDIVVITFSESIYLNGEQTSALTLIAECDKSCDHKKCRYFKVFGDFYTPSIYTEKNKFVLIKEKNKENIRLSS